MSPSVENFLPLIHPGNMGVELDFLLSVGSLSFFLASDFTILESLLWEREQRQSQALENY